MVNGVKPFKNMNKNPQSFQEKRHAQKDAHPSHKF